MVKEPSAVSPFPLSKSTVGIKCSRMLLDAADFVHRANIVQGDLSAKVANSKVKRF